MWTSTGLLGLAALLLPESNQEHIAIAIVMAAFAVGWGLFSLWMASRGRGMTVGFRALATAMTMPIVALSLWATGGATSFIQPVMIFTALFISYFFPPRLAWPLNCLFVLAFATPLFYDDRIVEVGYPARLVMFALAVAGATIAIHYLKGRLVRAELYQRTMAERDSLTGVSNRRAFDAALERAARTRDPYALILIDLDDFKRINTSRAIPPGTTCSARWRPPRPEWPGRATAWPASAATSSPCSRRAREPRASCASSVTSATRSSSRPRSQPAWCRTTR
jgi:predicted signal transduction protein with EAL and GGDEF domain